MRSDLPFSKSFQIPLVDPLYVQSGEITPHRTPPGSINATLSIANNAAALHVVEKSLWGYSKQAVVIRCVRHGLSSKEQCDLEFQQYATLQLTGVNVIKFDINVFTPFLDFSPDRSHIMT
jgi:hypothetical protein